MITTSHYHERIQRATERLAQLQAKELVANQRRELKAKELAKREEAKRRQRLVEIVFIAGAETLDDEELAGALLNHLDARKEPHLRQGAQRRGASRLSTIGDLNSSTMS